MDFQFHQFFHKINLPTNHKKNFKFILKNRQKYDVQFKKNLLYQKKIILKRKNVLKFYFIYQITL